ncbi:MAG: MATE family efflux transporter [Firmicutes bacterium]|nr:MATE family efflux transporter [Bacillota bacterium]
MKFKINYNNDCKTNCNNDYYKPNYNNECKFNFDHKYKHSFNEFTFFKSSVKLNIKSKLNTSKLIRKDVLEFTFPIITEQVLIILMGVVNAIMASRIGNEAVSGIGMVDSINNIFIAFISALAVGSTVVVAHYIGQDNVGNANETVKQGLFSGFLLTLTITLLIFIFRYNIINILYGSAEPLVKENAYAYLDITLFSYPLIAITSITCGVLRGAGDTKTPMKITILMNFINIVLSYILIYGIDIGILGIHIYFPGFKVKGAALGISTARLIGAILSISVLVRGSRIIKLKKLPLLKIDINIQKSIFGVGIPASVESLLFQGGKLITQIFIVTMGTSSIAANYVAGSIFTLINIPGSALSIAATAMVGQSMGRGEKEEAGNLLIYLTKLTAVCLFVPCALSFLLAPALSSLYSQVDEVISISSDLLRLNAVFMPLIWGIAFIIPAGLKGAGDARFTMVVSIISMWVFRITLGYLLGIPLKLGVRGVWLGMFADWLVRSILFYCRLKSGKWKEHSVIS